MVIRLVVTCIMPVALAACQAGSPDTGNAPGTSPDGFTGIGAGETIYYGGTEPFWGGEINAGSIRYATPDMPDGVVFPVERFTGQGGLAFSGLMNGTRFDMTITPGTCSDGMSDRSYPYTVTLQIGEGAQRNGCAHTDKQPFEGPENP